MTEERMALVELLQKSGDSDFLRAVAESVLQILMEADVEGLIGAGRHERTGDRLNYRNGYGGSTSFNRESRLAECWRDLHTVGQTVTLAPEWYPIGGRVYLGMDPGSRMR